MDGPDPDERDRFDPWLDDVDGGDVEGGSGDRTWPGGEGTSDPLHDDPRVAAGIEHLQRAAREVIAASRALLDVAEDVVESPDGVTKVIEVLAELGSLAQRAARQPASAVRHDGGPDDDPPVQRIPVS